MPLPLRALLVVSGCCGQRRQIPIIWRPQVIMFSVWPGLELKARVRVERGGALEDSSMELMKAASDLHGAFLGL